MTKEEIEVVVRAMTLTVEKLEADPVKQSMQEAFAQVLAHVVATRASIQKKVQVAGTGEAWPFLTEIITNAVPADYPGG
jgi:hypothetical protein